LRIIDLLGGRIGVDSARGLGTTFWFELAFPIVQSPLGPTPSPAAPASTLERRLRVLVAEDTPANQVVARAMLEKLGHRAQLVGDGDEAVVAAASGTFDLILMDVQMPVLDGYEATRRIRALPAPAGTTPIIALTAFAQAADREEARASGMTDYLGKPIRLPDLAAAIDRVFERPASVDAPALDASALAELRETVGDKVFRHLLDQFERDATLALGEIAAAHGSGNEPEIRRVAHRLVGLLDQFGATPAARAAARVETGDGAPGEAVAELLRLGRVAVAAVAALRAAP
jgi:CheY-like chemotaxis protein